jgi:hypothetical protein
MRVLDLQRIERRSWRMLQQDGLMDALFGVLFLAAAVVGILDQTTAPDWVRITTLVVIQFSGVAAMTLLRRRYVTPRLGRVKYSSRRVRNLRTLRLLLAACVLLTVALVVLTALSNRLGFTLFGDVGKLGTWLVISAVVFLPIAGIAFFLDYPRLLIYAALLSAAEFLHIVVELPKRVSYGGAIVYGIASVIAFFIGIPIFVRFLRGTPRMETVEGGGPNAC